MENKMKPTNLPKYTFYIELRNGEEVSWNNLTEKQAKDMYKYTDIRLPGNVERYGWKEQK